MKNIISLFVVAFMIAPSTWAGSGSLVEKASTKTFLLEGSVKEWIDLGLDADGVLLKIAKERDARNTPVKIEVTESLASCTLHKLWENPYYATYYLGIDWLNDGGYNSCTVLVRHAGQTSSIEFGAEVGE
jgi:hypothetical protein